LANRCFYSVSTDFFFLQPIHAPTRLLQVIAGRLLQSKQTIPHYYLSIDCAVDNLLATRATLNEMSDGGYKLSVNDFIVKVGPSLTLKPPTPHTFLFVRFHPAISSRLLAGCGNAREVQGCLAHQHGESQLEVA
jgi:hypothetical protein